MSEPRLRRSAPWIFQGALCVYALAAAVFTAAFFVRYPIPQTLAVVASILSALWLSYAFYSVGKFVRLGLTSWLGAPEWPGRWTTIFTNSMLGAGLLGVSVLLLGWAFPGDLRMKLRILFGVLVAVSAMDLITTARKVRFGPLPKWDAPALLATLPACGCVAAFLSCFGPITHYDSLVYHLALPAIYLREGAITALPFNLYSFFPATAEMIFLFVMGTLPAPEYTINLLGWLLAVGLGAAVAEWVREIAGAEGSWIATFLWWTAPMVLLLSTGAYVDLPLAGATFLAIRWYLSARESESLMAVGVAGFFAGLAFSIKYTGALTGAIIALDLAALAIVRRKTWLTLTVFVVASSFCAIPWLIKNGLACGNPVFPFFYRWLGGDVGWNAETAEGYFRMLTEYGVRSNFLFDLAVAPFRDATSTTARGGFDVLGDFGWPLILIFAPLAIFHRRTDRHVRFLSIYAALHFLAWYLSKPVLRFLISLLPIGVVLASIALRASTIDSRRYVRFGTLLFVVPWTVSNIFIYGMAASELRSFSVPFGSASAITYLRQRLSFYPTFEALNAGLSNGQRVLVIGEQRLYHLRTGFVSSNLFAPSPISKLCNDAKDSIEILDAIRQQGILAVVMSEGEIQRLGGAEKFGFSPNGERNLREFLKNHAKIVSEDRGVFLHKIHTS